MLLSTPIRTRTTRPARHTWFVLCLCGIALAWSALGSAALADATPSPAPQVVASPLATSIPQRFNAYIQSTYTQQNHGAFPAAFSGPQSLYNQPDGQHALDVTLYVGTRLWKGGEIYINPELDEGFGLGNPGLPGEPYNGTFGVAGFLNGENYKIGSASSYSRVQRCFIRQTFNLGGDLVAVDPDINKLGGSIDVQHLTLTAGLFAVTDVFDVNAYAHDPRNDFLNWSIIDMGSFDYAADAWGYTYGVSAELARTRSTLRLGLFQLSAEPNVIEIEHQPFLQYSPILEYEQDTSFFGGHPGAFKALVYGDDGYMGPYVDAVAAAAGTGIPPSTAAVRNNKHWKIGGGVNIAQEIAPHVGVFTRLSAMNGTYEAFDFTDIDRSLSAGVSIDGGLYHRAQDTIGLAAAFNGISNPAQQYFAAGGLGILIGDGGMTYSGEQILEGYYKVGLAKVGAITADYQYVVHPAYNVVRGPVSVYALRYHAQV